MSLVRIPKAGKVYTFAVLPLRKTVNPPNNNDCSAGADDID